MSVYHILRRGYKVLKQEFQEPVTIKHITAETVTSHDVPSVTYSTTVTKAIAYDYDSEYREQPFGEMKGSGQIFIFDKDETISVRDTIIYQSEENKVTRIEEFRTQIRGTLDDSTSAVICKIAHCEKAEAY